MTDKERLENIKDKQLYMHSLSTFDISWLIEQAEQNIRRISKSFELDEFLRDYSNTADKGRNLTDVAMDVIKRQAKRAQELEESNKRNYWIGTEFKFENLKLQEQNKRYREALEELRSRAMNVSPEREEDGSIIEDAESQFLYEFCNEVLEESK